MINNLVPRLILISLSFFFLLNFSAQANWVDAQKGNRIILIRHSLAPGGGDPPGFDLNDCKTQRNLNQTGINQSKRIGKLFKKK